MLLLAFLLLFFSSTDDCFNHSLTSWPGSVLNIIYFCYQNAFASMQKLNSTAYFCVFIFYFSVLFLSGNKLITPSIKHQTFQLSNQDKYHRKQSYYVALCAKHSSSFLPASSIFLISDFLSLSVDISQLCLSETSLPAGGITGGRPSPRGDRISMHCGSCSLW